MIVLTSFRRNITDDCGKYLAKFKIVNLVKCKQLTTETF